MPTVLPLRSGDPRRVGRYRLLGRIEGFTDPDGNPDAFLGRSAGGDLVTVTLPASPHAADAAARDRFTAEARAARLVEPFCVARITGAGLEDGRPYLVSEHVEGVSLREAAIASGPLTGAALTALAVGTATGLAAIHRAGLVHGAFGPDHVILGREGAKVVHFSITPPYGPATPAADLLAWALTVLFAAVGRPSVGPQDLAALPGPLQGAVAACLAPEPGSRPAAQAVLARLLRRDDAIAALLAEGARRARGAARDLPRPIPVRKARQRRRRSRVAAWVMACAACLLAITAAAWFISHRPGGLRGGGDATPAAQPAAPTRASAVPAAVAGTWSGWVRQINPVLAIHVEVTLTAGSAEGTVTYPALGCSGTLRLVSSTASGSVTMAQHITTGRQTCEDGEITLSPRQAGQLAFSFRRPDGSNPAGVLYQARPSPSPS
jgi:hypothetical protein